MTSPNREELEGLLGRVEKADTGGKELDRSLALAFGWTVYDDGMGVMTRLRDPDGVIGAHDAPKFSSSLDAALALVERLRPELFRFVGDLDPTDPRACTTLSEGYPDRPSYRGFAPPKQYALATVAALLSTLSGGGAGDVV